MMCRGHQCRSDPQAVLSAWGASLFARRVEFRSSNNSAGDFVDDCLSPALRWPKTTDLLYCSGSAARHCAWLIY